MEEIILGGDYIIEIIDDEEETPIVTDPIEEAPPAIAVGVITNCTKLNIRKEADKDSEVLAVIPSGTQVEVFLDNSTDDWFYVCTPVGIEGFCMATFVNM